jgi:hypothetical protein
LFPQKIHEMKYIISLILALVVLISCNTEKRGNMIVKGQIEGLKKGTIYLQKFNDSLLVSVDSVELNGVSDFILSSEIEMPEIYYISLDQKLEDKIPFFGEKGEIKVSTKLSKFQTAAHIEGSKNQELLDEHNDMIKKFNNKRLDLIKEKFEAQVANDTALASKIENDENGLLRRRYYFTTNYAVNHSGYEVAPYLAVTELIYANIKILDTINNSLSKKVKQSKYGLELERFIKDVKNE